MWFEYACMAFAVILFIGCLYEVMTMPDEGGYKDEDMGRSDR